jgi:hypothetical protein
MSHIAELGRLAVALLIEPGLWIGRALMGLVGSPLLVEAAFGIASRTVMIFVATILPPVLIEAQASISVPSTEK